MADKFHPRMVWLILTVPAETILLFIAVLLTLCRCYSWAHQLTSFVMFKFPGPQWYRGGPYPFVQEREATNDE